MHGLPNFHFEVKFASAKDAMFAGDLGHVTLQELRFMLKVFIAPTTTESRVFFWCRK